MIRRIYVPLDASERQALARLGELERRDPRAQAALLIRQQLERLGLLPLSPASPTIFTQEAAHVRSIK